MSGYAAAAGAAMQVVGTVGGIVAGIKGGQDIKKSIKKQIRSVETLHEAATAEREAMSRTARADVDIARTNLLQSEQAKLNVLSSLGQPGTYGSAYGPGPISLGILEPTGLAGLPGAEKDVLTSAGTITKRGRVRGADVALGGTPRFKGVRDWEVTGLDLDPTAMAGAVKGTAAFRTVSRMVAEAEQLMNRQGPLWNELNNSIVGGIYESSASFQRQQMEEVSRNLARGGTARRVGLKMAQSMQVQEGINRTRTGQLWQAKLGLEQFRSSYAQDVTNFSQAWVNNVSGIRDAFTSTLNNLQMFWSETMAPTLAASTVQAMAATQQARAEANQGMIDALQTKWNTIGGAFQALTGAGKQVMSMGGGSGGMMSGMMSGMMGGGGGGGGGMGAMSSMMGGGAAMGGGGAAAGGGGG